MTRLRLAIVLVALMTLAQVESPRASLSIFWRGAVLSFDSPTTQSLDELASGATPVADPAREARRSAHAAAVQSSPLPIAAVVVAVRTAARLAGVTRAPPEA
jgi:hypothetical protein